MLRLLGAAGAAAFFRRAEADTASCTVSTPQVTEGPYWVDEHLFRSDIRTDPATGVAHAGIPLALQITVLNSSASCGPLAGAYVDIWHCDAKGIYSDESTYNPGGGTGNVTTTGQKFLRGYQIADANGQVHFTTIYPGWYAGRTIHIHVRIRTYSGSTVLTDFVTQIFFDDTVNNSVLATSSYSRTTSRDTTNSNDSVYNGAANRTAMLATLSGSNDAGYSAAITIDLAAIAPTAGAPALAANSVLNAASGAPGVAPGAWISLFGSNLATSTYAVTADDLVSGYLPTNLKNTTVEIDGALAYLDYISPAQINLVAPSSSKTGTVNVVVTNANGSATVTATLQAILPGLFARNGYALAVRASDGAILTGSAAAAGDVIELYGTGLGPTSPAGIPGLVFSGAYPTTNPLTVTIGGVAAAVSFAGLVAAGLYQVNVTVPSGLAAGDHAVVAAVAGLGSQSTALLKVSR